MAKTDLYAVLGVARDASADEIRRAYRALAKAHHPDLNPGNKAAEDKFKSVASAYDILSDTEKRGRYDRGEIDETGAEAPPEHPAYRRYADGAEGRRYRQQPGAGMSEDEMSDIFSDLFGQARAGRDGAPRRGRDMQYRLSVDFLDAVRGATRRLTLPEGPGLDVRIPPGIEDGQVLRLKGKGGPGRDGGPAGDALIEVAILPHPVFRREGRDIHVEVPITYAEAVLGAKITVPTPSGPVSMTVPKHADSGTRLRLRGRGVAAQGAAAAGDEIVILKLVLGAVDEALETFLSDWPGRDKVDPRQGLAS